MLMEFPADLHIHTCLSPCADDEMIPVNILNMAKLLGTKIIGICDHNSAENVKAVLKAAQDHDILVIPGIEVQSVEEVHILCFFESLQQVLEFQSCVYKYLPSMQNNPVYFGHQWVVDERGNILSEEKRMLLTSTFMTVEQICEKAAALHGIAIPAHVDKNNYSIISQLGFIPDNLYIDAVEFSRSVTKKSFMSKFPQMDKYALITSSDAHRLREMVYQKTFFLIKSLTFNEVVKALKHVEGRKVLIRE